MLNTNFEDDVSVKQRIIILDKPKAGYPKSADGTICVRGAVRVKVTFLANGKIGSVSVVKGLPFGLTAKAIEAAEQMKFIPVTVNGIPVSTRKTVAFNFSIY